MAEENTLEVKDVLSFIGFDNVKDIEELKKGFNEKYIPSETHKTTLGEVNGKVTHAIKKNFKEVGIDISSDELKDVSTTDLPALYASKVKAKFEELESQTKLTKEQVESKLSEDLNKYKQQVTDLTKMKDTLSSEYTQFKTNVELENKNREINTRLNTAKGSLKFSDKVDEFTKKGFHVSVNEKFKFEVNEGKEAVRNDKGELVMSKANAGMPATFSEVYQEEFNATPFAAVADKTKVTTFVTPSQSASTQTTQVREVAPRH
jgi:hypothetical protein